MSLLQIKWLVLLPAAGKCQVMPATQPEGRAASSGVVCTRHRAGRVRVCVCRDGAEAAADQSVVAAKAIELHNRYHKVTV